MDIITFNTETYDSCTVNKFNIEYSKFNLMIHF